jgi:hypothetical protein
MASINDCTPEEFYGERMQRWKIDWSTGTAQKQPDKPLHYANLKIDPFLYCFENKLDIYQFSIIKYVTRWKDKNGLEDLEKALDCLKKYIDANPKRTD